jgi:hypothetical protein
VGEAERCRLRDAARCVPADCLGIVEVRLGAGEGAADLSVRLEWPEQARRMAGQLRELHVREFLARWAERKETQEPVWLEFDLHPGSAGLPSPILLTALPLQVDPLWLADSLLPALYGRALDASQREKVLLAARAVPGSARILYAFSLRPRPHEAVRLDILGLAEEERGEYLERVAPHLRILAEETAPLLAGTDRPHLSFDISSKALSRLGMEGSFLRQPKREPRWAELLARLVESGLCTPEKRDAVLTWGGNDSYWTAPDSWPVEMRGKSGFCIRALSHIKVVGELGRPPHAKAYLTFCHYLKKPTDSLPENLFEK